MPDVTWKPHSVHGELSSRRRSYLPDNVFAFPSERRAPLTDASHVRGALARFGRVGDVTDDEREVAFANIRAAAAHYHVEVAARDWRELIEGGPREAAHQR